MDRTLYKPGSGLIHSLNPATTITISICLSIFVFLFPDYRVAAVASLLLILASVVAGVHRTVLKLTAVAVIPLAFFLLIIRGVLSPSPNATPFVIVGPVTVWQEGVLITRLVTLRVTALVIVFLLLATTVHPQKMRIALIEKGLPPKFAYLVLAAFQTAPEIINRAEDIATAQRARGLDTSASLKQRFKSLSALLVPLMINSLILANTRALALNARGFDRKNAPTFWHEIPDPFVERVIRIGVVVIVIVTAIVRAVFIYT